SRDWSSDVCSSDLARTKDPSSVQGHGRCGASRKSHRRIIPTRYGAKSSSEGRHRGHNKSADINEDHYSVPLPRRLLGVLVFDRLAIFGIDGLGSCFVRIGFSLTDVVFLVDTNHVAKTGQETVEVRRRLCYVG